MEAYQYSSTLVVTSTSLQAAVSRAALSNQINVSHIDSTQEEAETILILHALEAARRENEVHIMNLDIDVFMLALAAGKITAAFHARVRGLVPGLGGLKETKLVLPHPRVKVSIVGSLRDREVACSASDRQGSNFESCVWRTVSSQSSHHPQEVLLAQFSLYVHKGGLKPDSFFFSNKTWDETCIHRNNLKFKFQYELCGSYYETWRRSG